MQLLAAGRSYRIGLDALLGSGTAGYDGYESEGEKGFFHGLIILLVELGIILGRITRAGSFCSFTAWFLR